SLLVGAVFTGAVIDAAAAAHLGQERSLSQSFVVGFQSSLRIFFAGVLVTIALALIGVVFNVASAFVSNGIVLFLIFCVYFFVQVYVQASWFVSPVIATIERHGPVSSASIVAALVRFPLAHRRPGPPPRRPVPGPLRPRRLPHYAHRRGESERRRCRHLHRGLRGRAALDAALFRHDDGALLRSARSQRGIRSAAR